MHTQKALTIICVAIGVLVLLLTQTEGFVDANSPQDIAYYDALQYSNAVGNKKWDLEIAAAYKAAHTNRTLAAFKHADELRKQKNDEIHKIFLDEARKKGFDPNRKVIATHPAVKNVHAVVPSQPVVKKEQPVRPSQPKKV